MTTEWWDSQQMDSNRKSHAPLDLESRHLKALKIARILALEESGNDLRILEIGAGSGGISHYLDRIGRGRFRIDAVDVRDERVVQEGYRFQLVEGTILPFPDAEFDVVISNHVIEHVGERADQKAHLREIRRVLKSSGRGYIAVPNRWMLVEPHYRLPFLSWLPRSLRSPYLRFCRKGSFYDCEPLELGELEGLLKESGFSYRNECMAAMRLMQELENPDSLALRISVKVPDSLMKWSLRAFPTLIYSIQKFPL